MKKNLARRIQIQWIPFSDPGEIQRQVNSLLTEGVERQLLTLPLSPAQEATVLEHIMELLRNPNHWY